jgi:TetR/AcrR family fatty acid metabolism transcriptional regulator
MGRPTNQTNDKYRRILDAAGSVFSRNGFHQSTVSEIARAAGVADGTIYLYFKNKDDILVQFFHFKMKQVFTRFQEEVGQIDGAVDKLKRLIHIHLSAFQADKDMAIVYQAETRRYSRFVEDQIREMAALYFDLVAEIVEKGQQEGIMRKDLYLGLVKRFLLGAVEEVISTWLMSGGKYDLTTMAEPLADLVFRGIGTPGPEYDPASNPVLSS